MPFCFHLDNPPSPFDRETEREQAASRSIGAPHPYAHNNCRIKVTKLVAWQWIGKRSPSQDEGVDLEVSGRSGFVERGGEGWRGKLEIFNRDYHLAKIL